MSVTITSSTATTTTCGLSPGPGAPTSSSVPLDHVRGNPTRSCSPQHRRRPTWWRTLRRRCRSSNTVRSTRRAVRGRLPGPQPELLPNLVSSRVGPLSLHNGPVFGVTDPDWTGCAAGFVDGGRGPSGSSFYPDDLLDCGWPAAGTWTVPDDAPSGGDASVLLRHAGRRTLSPSPSRPAAGPEPGDPAAAHVHLSGVRQ